MAKKSGLWETLKKKKEKPRKECKFAQKFWKKIWIIF